MRRQIYKDYFVNNQVFQNLNHFELKTTGAWANKKRFATFEGEKICEIKNDVIKIIKPKKEFKLDQGKLNVKELEKFNNALFESRIRIAEEKDNLNLILLENNTYANYIEMQTNIKIARLNAANMAMEEMLEKNNSFISI